ncbi:hypothetical protein FBEOM_7458 [Fusarium beomiforme]|uniref:Uncharacterized protein n=1 Tax=Fusarium beomiforme TaxID=44412 RepID=A0A9P5AHF0_9HYPO|nr:hypothetical protein FBEOM_7458 [Fusarium beomiforme]
MTDRQDEPEYCQYYRTKYYVEVSKLPKNASGKVYGPALGPPPPAPTFKEFRPKTPRPGTPRPVGDRPLEIPGKGIFNVNWEKNMRRVFGPEFVHNWRHLGDMTWVCITFCRNKPARGRMNRTWTVEEIEKFGRLSVWGVHQDVIEALIGWQSQWFHESEAHHYVEAVWDEMRYIPTSEEHWRALMA